MWVLVRKAQARARLGACKTALSPQVISNPVVVLSVLCFGVIFVLFEPYLRFHIFSYVRVTEWPSVGK